MGKRVHVTINTEGTKRINKPIEVAINCTEFFGLNESFSENSIWIEEIDNTGTTINSDIPFQFDKESKGSKVSGTLTFIMLGETKPTQERAYYIYYDSNHTQQNRKEDAASQSVSVSEENNYQGQDSFRITTTAGTYFYHKQGAGFASMLDPDGIDWISYRPGGESAGEYRGIPNIKQNGDDSGLFHPGYTRSETYLKTSGPLKATIISRTEVAGQAWSITWDFFPSYTIFTLTEKGPGDYWFLYEGTPHGELNLTHNYYRLSDGSHMTMDEEWKEQPLPHPKWLYFGDDRTQRVLYFINHSNDGDEDRFYQMKENMTVFGFGRGINAKRQLLKKVPTQFTIGFSENADFNITSEAINSAYKPLKVTVSLVEGVL